MRMAWLTVGRLAEVSCARSRSDGSRTPSGSPAETINCSIWPAISSAATGSLARCPAGARRTCHTSAACVCFDRANDPSQRLSDHTILAAGPYPAKPVRQAASWAVTRGQSPAGSARGAGGRRLRIRGDLAARAYTTEDSMRYAKLGKTGLEVSAITLGCMSFGEPSGRGRPWTLDEDACRDIVRQALDAGVNAFDTANVYSSGRSEEITGQALMD